VYLGVQFKNFAQGIGFCRTGPAPRITRDALKKTVACLASSTNEK